MPRQTSCTDRAAEPEGAELEGAELEGAELAKHTQNA